jgi:hypothetical protein
MNVWERLMRIVEAGPFGSPGTNVRNVQLTDQELDAVIQVLENSVEKNVKGIDVDALEKKLYMVKVKKESMGSGNSTSHGDAGEAETEVERAY